MRVDLQHYQAYPDITSDETFYVEIEPCIVQDFFTNEEIIKSPFSVETERPFMHMFELFRTIVDDLYFPIYR